MTKYVLLNTIVLLAIVSIITCYTRKRINAPLWYTLVIVLALTAVFDSLIIAADIVAYNPDNILGIYIWRAPVEDFAYAVASVLMVGLLWEYYESNN